MFIIGGVQKTTLIDFPGKIAAIVFTHGCNFRCGYCHNPSLLLNKEKVVNNYTTKDFFSFLQTRIGKLDGVVITGGEPTLQSGLYDFIKEIEQMGFAVKLDTNGTNPDVIEKLLNDNLLDYIAMDIKAPLEKYSQITGTYSLAPLGRGGGGEGLHYNIRKSISIIMQSNVDYEFRTTVIKSQLSFEDFEKIGQMIKGAKRYYMQKFVPSEILDKNLINEQTYTDEEFKNICQTIKKYVEFVDFR